MLDRDMIREKAHVACSAFFPNAETMVAGAELLANALICLNQIAITAAYAHRNMVAMEERGGRADG